MQERTFLITVDTEGDNLWNWQAGQILETKNAQFIPRFQALCEKYGFKPVYLTNYEMALDESWVQYSGAKAREGKCEIGMHLHGWNTPPEYALENRFGHNAYITEYPADIMEQKVTTMMDLLQQRYEMPILSHRSGRWALNNQYLAILAEQGIRIDCSVTPQLNLSQIPGYSVKGGNDYRSAPKDIYRIHPDIIEIPMSTRRIHHLGEGSWRRKLKNILFGDELWLRPIRLSTRPLNQLTQQIAEKEKSSYLEFMIHSSELMPGGSIYFKDQETIEKLYEIMEQYFAFVAELGYKGQTLQEFSESFEDSV